MEQRQHSCGCGSPCRQGGEEGRVTSGPGLLVVVVGLRHAHALAPESWAPLPSVAAGGNAARHEAAAHAVVAAGAVPSPSGSAVVAVPRSRAPVDKGRPVAPGPAPGPKAPVPLPKATAKETCRPIRCTSRQRSC